MRRTSIFAAIGGATIAIAHVLILFVCPPEIMLLMLMQLKTAKIFLVHLG
jgi:hypothetical protein